MGDMVDDSRVSLSDSRRSVEAGPGVAVTQSDLNTRATHNNEQPHLPDGREEIDEVKSEGADDLEPSKTNARKVVYRREYTNEESRQVIFTEDLDDLGKDLYREKETNHFEVIENCYTAQLLAEDKEGKPKRPRGRIKPTVEIGIKSEAVLHALRTVVTYYPQQSLDDSFLRIKQPFLIVHHHRKELSRYRDQFSPEIGIHDGCTGFEDVYEDLGILFQLVDQQWATSQEEEGRWIADIPRCTFRMLWSLFKPGMDVYYDRHEDGNLTAAVVSRVSWIHSEVGNNDSSNCVLSLWQMDADAIYVGPCTEIFVLIASFAGEKEIGSLRVFPCKFMRRDRHDTSHEEKQKELEDRGSKFFDLLKGPQFVHYNGRSTNWPRHHYCGAAMVDKGESATCEEFNTELAAPSDIEQSSTVPSRCTCSRCKEISKQWSGSRNMFAGYTKINPLKQDTLTAHQRFLCTNSLPAFIFRLRAWQPLEVDGFRWPSCKTGLMESLILPTTTRVLLQRLAQRYTSSEGDATWSADLIEGKGDGAVILLHGPPGVGKTYTAECIAEEARRPLLTLTCADIGIEAVAVEQHLEKWFKLAKHWGAVLLLDEADVYMEHRTVTDLQRNNLVASFLRNLEYYQGILILTTNRVGTFDEAFLSRIDIAIGYQTFTAEQRIHIWDTFFSKLEREREGKMRVAQRARDYVQEDPKLLSLNWNARQIRSAFQTAVVLAEVEGKEEKKGDAMIAVTDKHIKTTVETSRQFKDYLKNLHGTSQAQIAQNRRLRFDEQVEEERAGEASSPV